MSHKAETHFAEAFQVESKVEKAHNLFVMRAAIQKLRDDLPLEGEAILLRYAKLQVKSVAECRESPECIFWAGRSIPSLDELTELTAMEERK